MGGVVDRMHAGISLLLLVNCGLDADRLGSCLGAVPEFHQTTLKLNLCCIFLNHWTILLGISHLEWFIEWYYELMVYATSLYPLNFLRLPDAEERSLEQYIERAELEDELQWDDELLFNKQSFYWSMEHQRSTKTVAKSSENRVSLSFWVVEKWSLSIYSHLIPIFLCFILVRVSTKFDHGKRRIWRCVDLWQWQRHNCETHNPCWPLAPAHVSTVDSFWKDLTKVCCQETLQRISCN